MISEFSEVSGQWLGWGSPCREVMAGRVSGPGIPTARPGRGPETGGDEARGEGPRKEEVLDNYSFSLKR